ncbi:2OG-Fe(II) oxygenase [Thiorhodococcus mannitoliphagus]|uniref:2OG-Fe(II) oxygenase n=1 Tax=Thiorhodococcus mannitoliphagus TaxID=329406 RepID=A0A6P1DP74_9GAMM|nr:2OG-Fe(II) oxygenase [Thiorhodococcus mannitoliphagus]NEX19729.1 2OG-Fe(II) oxygenase [Thiorhodococcus mannitoliphagus]
MSLSAASLQRPDLVERADYYDHRTLHDVLDADACRHLINVVDADAGDRTAYVDPQGKVTRHADVWWIAPDAADAQGLIQRIVALVRQVNQDYYGFDLDDTQEADFQFTRYGAGHFYGWHTDIGKDHLSRRKLSVVVQLSDPASYVGCNLQFHGHEQQLELATRAQGSVTVFPSFRSHAVTKLIWGTRWSLVGWLEGPLFR